MFLLMGGGLRTDAYLTQLLADSGFSYQRNIATAGEINLADAEAGVGDSAGTGLIIYYPSSCPSPARGEGTHSLAPRPLRVRGRTIAGSLKVRQNKRLLRRLRQRT